MDERLRCLSHPFKCVNFVTYLFLIIGIWCLGFSIQFSHIVWLLCPVNKIWWGGGVGGVFGVNTYTAEIWDHRGIKCVQMSIFIRTGFFLRFCFSVCLFPSCQGCRCCCCYCFCCLFAFSRSHFPTPMNVKRIYYGVLMLPSLMVIQCVFYFVFASKTLSFAIFTDMVYPKWVYRMATKDKLNSKSFVSPTSN